MIKNTISASDDIILNLKVLAKEKESVRRKLAVTAAKLAITAKKLAITAKEKESVRRKLVITAAQLASTAEKLAATAKEKESVRRKLVITAAKLAATAEEKEGVRRKLVVTAKEKESVRRKLVVTAKQLNRSYGTLEKKVFERTKSLEMSHAKEEAILLSIGEGLLVTDETGKIIIVNKTAEQLFGKKGKELIGKVFSDAIVLENENGTHISLDKNSSAYYYARKDEVRFPMAIMATPVVLNGRVIGAIKIFRDITSERAIDKAKTEFVSLASHQLRTPLSTVNWYAEMLLAGDVGELNEKQKNYLDEVYRSNQRMVELVNALLDVSSLELGTFVIEPQPTDILKLAQSVIDEEKPQIQARKIRFSFSHGKNIPLMQADPKLLRMVVQNVLSNAVKYTAEQGKIEMSLALKNKNNVLLKIADSGYGIPKNQHDKIFTKLFRADNVRDKDTDGTGLGLYIVKSIVDNSGGKIWFSSHEGSASGEKSSKSTGTTFYVELPLDGMRKSVKV